MTVDPPTERGVTVWLTGLPCAGKSTLARALATGLRARGRRVELLDGEEVRTHLSRGLGFSREDRDVHVRRMGHVARLLTRNGTVVVAAAVSPYRSARRWCRDAIGDFVEVHVDAPVEVCEHRDTRGLYDRARRGEVARFTGVSDPYEAPEAPELHLATDVVAPHDCVAAMLSTLEALGYLDLASS